MRHSIDLPRDSDLSFRYEFAAGGRALCWADRLRKAADKWEGSRPSRVRGLIRRNAGLGPAAGR